MKPRFSSSRVVCFAHHAVRFSFSHLMHFKQQKHLCILLKTNIHAFTFSMFIYIYKVLQSKYTFYSENGFQSSWLCYWSQLTLWCWKSPTVNIQHAADKTKHLLQPSSWTCKVKDGHLHPRCFSEYTGHLIPAHKA